mmetsp:Transcript_12945/g.12931  ORF Transcript_12945/g.12931 Transcript_12945/m.12931 type:complete len:168 (+) Transcript_12945:100-603(+)
MARLIDTINRVLHERRKIILQERKKEKAGTSSPAVTFSHRYESMFDRPRRNGSMEAPKVNADIMMSTQPILNKIGLPELKVTESIKKVRDRKTKLFMMDNAKGEKRIQDYQKKWKEAQKQKNKILQNQVEKIQKKEQKRLESLKKYEQIEKAHEKKVRQDHREFLQK